MAVNINLFLKQKFEEYQLASAVKTLELYSNVNNQYLKNLFAILHQEFNRLFNFMFSKTNMHFNAEESRQLLAYIKLYEDMEYILRNTEFSFEINNNYKNFINECKKFLVTSCGSEIPSNLNHINIIEYEPIFILNNTVKITTKKGEKTFPIKLIGEGSYASVYKYIDEFYNKNFIIKKAKKDLTPKEIERFKKEYLIMKNLKSPYILEVYRFDDEKQEYYAEFADDTLYNYINTNNSQLNITIRKSIVYQIFKAFSYIHSKDLLHRDISLTNILLIFFEDSIIVKVSDFGLVKEKNSNLTSTDSNIKGSLNDSNLAIIGFNHYSIEYETYALTRLILFIMTGKTNLEKIRNPKIKAFVLKGTNGDINKRYKSIEEMKEHFNIAFGK